VQYKGKASEMFAELLSDIRVGVISRMFIYRPRQPEKAPVERPGDRIPVQETPEPAASRVPGDGKPAIAVKPAPSQPTGGGARPGGKKKRHRH